MRSCQVEAFLFRKQPTSRELRALIPKVRSAPSCSIIAVTAHCSRAALMHSCLLGMLTMQVTLAKHCNHLAPGCVLTTTC